jgi:serine/threonine protein kinase
MRHILQVEQLLRALQYMHDERAIMHGDIKPANLLLLGCRPPCHPLPLCEYSTAVLKVADFGLAKHVQVSKCQCDRASNCVYISRSASFVCANFYLLHMHLLRRVAVTTARFRNHLRHP